MSDEKFLARWSRRKRDVKQVDEVEPHLTATAEAQGPAASVHPADRPDDPIPDPSSLPPIDSIDAATDITAFLREGIPQELSRAALRRAWAADPAIRDFMGLAENAWDFNDPNAMPGFGPLDYSAGQIDALVRRVVGGAAQAAENLLNPRAQAGDTGQSAGPAGDLGHGPSRTEATDGRRALDPPAEELQPVSAAPQPQVVKPVECEETPVRRRTHGSALPHQGATKGP
jgi:hypothetical protein